MKLCKGQILENFTFDTAYEKGLNLKDALRGGKAAVVFLRYYGCPLCQYDIHLYAEGYGRIRAAGGQLFVVLQSFPATLRAKLAPDSLPFPIICDPDRALYRAFDIRPAPSKEAMGGGNTEEKIKAVRAMGLKHGEYEGDELQLPAAFVVTGNLRLTYVRYGENVGDVPTVDELVGYLTEIQ